MPEDSQTDGGPPYPEDLKKDFEYLRAKAVDARGANIAAVAALKELAATQADLATARKEALAVFDEAKSARLEAREARNEVLTSLLEAKDYRLGLSARAQELQDLLNFRLGEVVKDVVGLMEPELDTIRVKLVEEIRPIVREAMEGVEWWKVDAQGRIAALKGELATVREEVAALRTSASRLAGSLWLTAIIGAAALLALAITLLIKTT